MTPERNSALIRRFFCFLLSLFLFEVLSPFVEASSNSTYDKPNLNLVGIKEGSIHELTYSDHNDLSETSSKDTGGTFTEAIRLIKEYYFESLSEDRLLREPLQKLFFALPPTCGDEPVLEGVSGDIDSLATYAIETISDNCGRDTESLGVSLLHFLMSGLDPNSGLLDAEMLRELKISTEGKFGGVGMVVEPRGNDYVVISAIDGSPAKKAGIRAGAVVSRIDGISVRGFSLPKVLSLVRGAEGSTMSVEFWDEGRGVLRTVQMKRRIIKVSPVRFTILPNKIGYLRIVNFQQDTAIEVRKSLLKMFRSSRKPANRLILDLRGNPGGLFNEAIKVAHFFLSNSPITYIKGRNRNLNREFIADAHDALTNIPVAVLVNRGTASAAEILTGALQGKTNVIVLGERTFGKASVQAVFGLSNGMALRLTTAHYFTANGTDIEKRGIEPDINFSSEKIVGASMHDLTSREELENDPEIQFAVRELLARKSQSNDR
jgi:carboxyl-terminal processing protease